jgi:4-alpha-glucanotransferase
VPVSPDKELTALSQLARLKGLQTSYFNVDRERVPARAESVLKILEAFGVPLGSPTDALEAIRQHLQAYWSYATEPVLIAWDGSPSPLPLRMRADAHGRLTCHLELETGETREWGVEIEALPGGQSATVAGTQVVERSLQLDNVPLGYHRLSLRGAGFEAEIAVIAAPMQAFEANDGQRWGVFLPLYALHTADSWGAGDYSDLDSLAQWLDGRGGHIVATLPLLPTFVDHPSPYSPVSRLLWNEFYLDPRKARELDKAPEVQKLLASKKVQGDIQRLRDAKWVDYKGGMALKRELLTALSQSDAGRATVRAKAAADENVAEYARFRAATEHFGKPWQQWPEGLTAGKLQPAHYDKESFDYYVYAQALADTQLSAVAKAANARGQGFYLDLPIGSNPDGYDTWRFRDTFALGASVGAPPDVVFTGGQDWGFPPAHPEAQRRSGYDFLRRLVRHHLRFANVLRLDHVMGLHRLFWIPSGGSAADGVYVRYPASELYAVLSLESHRHNATMVGENLGTVPLYVNADLARHNIYQTYVLQYELEGGARKMKLPPRRSFASLNTHDMPPYASFLTGSDIDLREGRGLIKPEFATRERAFRAGQIANLKTLLDDKTLLPSEAEDPKPLFEASLAYLVQSPARYVIVNLEDAWQETEPQNIPGTAEGNWTRKATRSLEEFPDVEVPR